MSTKERMDK